MVDLIAKSPCDGLLPVTIGTLSVSEVESTSLTSLAPFKGQSIALGKALKAAHGVEAPAPGHTAHSGDTRVLWFGQDMLLLMGPDPDAKLAKHAALTDQSDAWAVVELSGDGASDVMARLTPLDLRARQFSTGQTARTEVQHMMASVTRMGPEAWMIMVFRGFAETLVHDLRVAMETVTARR